MERKQYASLSSPYGYGSIDVRATYAKLPCQPFWTWLTGKALPSGEPRKPADTRLTMFQFLLQIAWSWSVVACSILVASRADHWLVSTIAIVLVMNRTRGLLHTFHYTSHGASIADMKLARVLAKYFMSIPILHLTWDEYIRIHASDHHGYNTICTDEDPDQKFMIAHRFKPVMTEREFWWRVVAEPFNPLHIFGNIWFRIRHNFILPPWRERAPRIVFWFVSFAVVTRFELWEPYALYYLLPLLVVTQFSSYIQHVTEHMWFPAPQSTGQPIQAWVNTLTWGRFLGRPYPSPEESRPFRHALRILDWWLRALLIDLPCRICVFMQDLSSHDYHHRSAKVNFWSISRERANSEGRPSVWGPMRETWSIVESLRVVRDHLVAGVPDPFLHGTTISHRQPVATSPRCS